MKRPKGGAMVVVFALLLVVLPILYVLSIGPLVWLHETGRINAGRGTIFERIYWPLERAGKTFPPLNDAIEWYARQWAPPRKPLKIPIPTPAPAPATPPAGS